MARYCTGMNLLRIVALLMLLACVHQYMATGSLAGYTFVSDASELQDFDKLMQGMNAFGASQYPESIRIARELIASSTDPDILDEAKQLVLFSTRSASGYKAAMQEVDNLGVAQSLSDVVAILKDQQASYEAAIKEEKAIIAQSPTSTEAGKAAYSIAVLTLMYGSRADTIAALEQIVAEYPQVIDSSVGEKTARSLVRLYVEEKGDSAAIDTLRNLALSDQNTKTGAAAAFGIGSIRRSEGNFDGALTAYREAIKRSSNSSSAISAVRAITNLGTGEGKGEASLTALASVQNTYPKSNVAAYALYGMAKIYESQKQANYAFAAYKQIVVEHTNIPADIQSDIQQAAKSCYRQGFVYAGQGQFQQAKAEFQKVLDLKPVRNKLTAEQQAILLIDTRDSTDILIKDVAVEARYQKALCHQVLGEDASAIAELEKIVKDCSDSELAPRAQVLVEEIKNK